MMFHFIFFLWGVGGIGDNNPSGLIFLASIAIFDMNIAVSSKKKVKDYINFLFLPAAFDCVNTCACMFFFPRNLPFYPYKMIW